MSTYLLSFTRDRTFFRTFSRDEIERLTKEKDQVQQQLIELQNNLRPVAIHYVDTEADQ